MTGNFFSSSAILRVSRLTVTHGVRYRSSKKYTTRKKDDCERETRQNGKQRKEQIRKEINKKKC
jgi:hypothetical protein